MGSTKFGQFSSLTWLLLSLLCCVPCVHMWSLKVVHVCVATLGFFSGLWWASTQSQPAYSCPSYATVGPSHLPTDNAAGSGHCLLLQINWVPSTMTEKLPTLTAWPVLAFTKPGGRWNQSRTEHHIFPFLLPEVQQFLKHNSFEIVVNLVSFQNTEMVVCFNFAQLYICFLGIAFINSLIPA